MLGFTFLQAQPGPGRERADAETRAQRQTERMAEQLGLSEAQATKVGEVNLNFAKKMQEAFQSAEGDRTAMRATMQTLRAEHKEELKQYLTEEQFANFEKLEAKGRERRGQRGREGRGGRNANPDGDGGR